jgi:thiol:disulfide interchange protein DsbD
MTTVTMSASGVAALLAAVVPAAASADQPPTRRAEVQLVSELRGVPPSDSFWVGLRVALRPGWHTYWTNPGDSGAPARVEWTLPPGVVAGDILWPAPHRLENPPFVDFGYHGDVLLLVPLRTSDLGRTASVSLAADVRLLVCRDVCLPERSTVTITLPVTRSPQKRPDVEPLFAQARRRVPRAPPSSWRLRAEARERRDILTIDAAQPTRAIEFFPLRPLEIRHAAPQPYRRLPAGVSLTLEMDERRREPPPRLTGVLVIDHEGSVTVDVPVVPERVP